MAPGVAAPILSRRAWLAGLAGCVACSRSPSDPVEQLVDELKAAAEARDTDSFEARLSESFRGHSGLGRAEAVATLRRYFAAYESVGIDVYGVEVVREAGTADVRCVVEFSGRARKLAGLEGLLPPSAVYRFELHVAEEDGVWRVQEADWETVGPAEMP